jgi:hypothetical protein
MAIDLTKFKNTSFALLIWYFHEEQEEAKIFAGVATWNEETKTVDVCTKGTNKLVIAITEDLFERIRIVTDDMKETFKNCGYGIPLYMTDLPNDTDSDGLRSLGINWNE